MESLNQRNSIIVKQLVQEIEEKRLRLSVFRVSDECFNHLSYSSALHTGFEPAKPFSSTDFRSAPSPPGHTAYILESKFYFNFLT